jgi:hypothetical protein
LFVNSRGKYVRIIGGVSRAWQRRNRGEAKLYVGHNVFYCALVAAAAAATTRSSGRNLFRESGRSAIPISIRRAKYRKLNGIFLSSALGAGYFLVLIQDNSFERRLTIVANVFVNGHEEFSISNPN